MLSCNTKTYYTLPWKSFSCFRLFWKKLNTDLGRLHNSAQLYWPFACLILLLNIQEFLHINSYPYPDLSHFPFIIIVRVEVGRVRKKSEACAKDRPDLYRLCLVQWKHTRGFSTPFRLLDFLKLLEDFRTNIRLHVYSFNFSDLFSHIKTALLTRNSAQLGLNILRIWTCNVPSGSFSLKRNVAAVSCFICLRSWARNLFYSEILDTHKKNPKIPLC